MLRRRLMVAGIAAIGGILSTSCGNSDLPDSFRLEDFRVLALVADHPEVNPGDTVAITPLLSDIKGAGRALSFSAQGCIDSGVGFGAEPTCTDSATETTFATKVAVTGLRAPDYTGLAASTITVKVPPAAVIFAERSAEDQFNGINYLVTVQFSVTPSLVVRAFRRIVVSTKPAKNENPRYGTTPLLSGSKPLTAAPSVITAMHPSLASGTKGTYSFSNPDGSTEKRTEKISTTWYISDGDLSLKVTDDELVTEFTPPAVPPKGHDLAIVMVTRDDRDGVTAFVQTF